MNIIIPKGNNYNLTDSQDYADFKKDLIISPIKKELEFNRYLIIINSNKEVPFKVKIEGTDKWVVGKCNKESWTKNVSKYAIAITWEKWVEMNTGIKLHEKIRSQLYKALSNSGIFSVTVKTLSPINKLANTDEKTN